jgi:hypothetical protein
MTTTQRRINLLRHAIQDGSDWPDSNWGCAQVESETEEDWDSLVRLGLAEEARDESGPFYSLRFYHVTPAGVALVLATEQMSAEPTPERASTSCLDDDDDGWWCDG